jgi:predicted AAA+ superfamily ATPase
MIPREIRLSQSQSFFLFGARGTGKSTLLKSHFLPSEALTIDLLLPEHFDPLLRNPQSLLSQVRALPKQRKWVIIDEVQKLPSLLDIVHHCIENEGRYFALTGSSARKLKRGQANLLAGRAFVYHLFPLTHRELGEKFSLLCALNFGTLPKLFEFDNDQDRELFLTSYTHTYLKEEIMAEQIVRALPPFRRFLEIAAQMNGELVNFSGIARDVGVNDKTVRSYFQILEDTLIGVLIDAYHRSVRKTQLQAPRFFFFDCGVKRALEGSLSSPLTEPSYAFGKAFEHFLVLEIIRLNSYLRKNYRLFQLRTQGGSEVDLILERPGQKTALLEIKSRTLIRQDHLKQLETFRSDIPNSEAICLSRDPATKRIGKVMCYPWQEGLRALGFE